MIYGSTGSIGMDVSLPYFNVGIIDAQGNLIKMQDTQDGQITWRRSMLGDRAPLIVDALATGT
ncbi:MAG: hypothetical protein KAJ01_08865, partial [Candidatus Hydrogenedentes bacterium]|nr:hypothetical protein [Candidatus Hydrogenedentota bacterium]